MLAPLALLVVLGSDDGWSKVETREGITVESRKVKDSSFLELRLTTTSKKSLASLCDEAWGDGKFDPTEPDLKLRTVLQESATERVVYEQITPPVVSPRDYALRFTLERTEHTCIVKYVTAPELAPALPKGFVRIERQWGSWTLTEADGVVTVVFITYADPGGALPAFITSGGHRNESVNRVKLFLSHAKP
ncbi:MAG: hypothetical protein U0228_10980 [Myxococcaceae bacterium]